MSCLQTCILHMHVCLCRKVEKPLERLSIIYINHTDNFMLRQLTSFKKNKSTRGDSCCVRTAYYLWI